MTGEQKEFLRRINEEKWPIFNRTNNRNRLRIGDSIVFYIAGRNGHKFLGSASVHSQLIKAGDLNSYIQLANAKVWKKPVMIENIIGDLEFIKNKTNWGGYLQGGVIRIGKKDFDTIQAHA